MRGVKYLLLTVVMACSGVSGVQLVVEETPEPPSYEAKAYEFDSPEKYYEQATGYLEKEMPQHAIDVFAQMVVKFPDFERNVEAYLSMARIYSDVYRDYEEAITRYKFIAEKYPEAEETFKAYFMLGFINANYLENQEQAELYYNEFLKKYPEHELAPSVQFELENLGQATDDFFITTEDDSVHTDNNK